MRSNEKWDKVKNKKVLIKIDENMYISDCLRGKVIN